LYEITTANAHLFESSRTKQHVYKTGVYAFTFEYAYNIYYYKRAAGKDKIQYDYMTVDIHNGINSYICSRKTVLAENNYKALIPGILNSIKYSGEKRPLK